MPGPHDTLMKFEFSQPDRAADALRAVLPPKLAAQFDWSTLRLEPGSHVDSDLEQSHSDLIFSIETLDREPSCIYVLFEHQSADDKLMPLRLLRYMIRIWDKWIVDHLRHGGKLPPILPVVLHNGASKWSAPTEMFEMMRGEPALLEQLKPFLPNFRFVLEDLGVVTREEIKARKMAASSKLVMLALKFGRDPQVVEVMSEERDLFFELLGNEGRVLNVVVHYLTEVRDGDWDGFLAQLQKGLGPEMKEVVMTVAEQLRAVGREQGREQGRAQGRVETVRKNLFDLASLKFGALPESFEARINGAPVAQVETWLKRILTASRPSELFD
jgi:hypothetical protein